MKNDGENWLCENEFYLFSPNCDYIFRKGIVDTLLAINMDKDVIEEGIEKRFRLVRKNDMDIIL